MKIAAVIVAAGRASRFDGGNKLLADLDGLPLIRHAAGAVAQSRVTSALLVVPQDSAAIVEAAGYGPWTAVINADAMGGLSSSIRTGISALDPSIDGALFILADMPFVTAKLIDRLCETFAQNDGVRIVFPVTRDGRQSNPVLWPRALFPALSQLSGDKGGKALLNDHGDLHAPVQLADDAAAFDIDTVADLALANALRS